MEILVIPSTKSKRVQLDPLALDFPETKQIPIEDAEKALKGVEAVRYLNPKARPKVSKLPRTSPSSNEKSSSWSGIIG